MMENAGIVLLISCYELGHQPAGLTGPMAFVRRAGFEVEAVDLSVQGLDAAQVARASFVGISVPMHTALRLGVEVAQRVRELNPTCHICFYGLYAILNQDHLLATVADSVLGGESEQGLVEIVDRAGQGKSETLSEDSSRQPALAGKRGSRAISRPLDFPRP
ncbi:MAG TPA: CUAEP/CCAEP-tail radical SAM protein, partial [Blastocatellia bacterium]|nr:CUAEP/CCAEP-tail radical SAM protein [Blastocatellia bacterium]